MSKTLGIGVIGMGWMGMVHSRSHRAISDRFRQDGLQVRLVRCADEVEDRVGEARERFGFASASTDWREVVDDPEVEAVIVTAPNHLHLEMVRATTSAGKHIFCEKPVGRNPQETAEIEQLARRREGPGGASRTPQ